MFGEKIRFCIKWLEPGAMGISLNKLKFMVRGAGAVSFLAVMFASQNAYSQAGSIIDDILNATGRDQWKDQFDSRGSQDKKVASTLPIFAPETLTNIEQAIAKYSYIVSSGGWPVVPANRKLRLGSNDPNVAILRKRLIISGDLSARAGNSNQFDTYVKTAIKRFQRRHGLPADGVPGRFTYAALNIPADVRLGQLETNLVRLRSMSGFLGDRYVMVNIPAARIEAVENNRVALRHTAIVGRVSRQTPILSSKIYEINLNPYWTSPVSIIRKDIIPLMRKNPSYVTDSKIRIFKRDGSEIMPENIDWSTEEAVKYRFRQEPGRNNAMGSAKINFSNPHAVYLHDTPQQSLFNRQLRFISSGCVRVQNVRDLLTWLAKDTEGWSRRQIEQTIASGDRINVKLAAPVPIYLTYVTAWSTANGIVHFRDDTYRRDGVEEIAFGQ